MAGKLLCGALVVCTVVVVVVGLAFYADKGTAFNIIPAHGYASCQAGETCEISVLISASWEELGGSDVEIYFDRLYGTHGAYEREVQYRRMANGQTIATYTTIFATPGDYALNVHVVPVGSSAMAITFQPVNVVVWQPTSY